MKPFAVVRVDQDLVDMVTPRAAGRRESLVFANVERGERIRPHEFNGDHPVYFTDNEADAEFLAGLLATKRPGTYWLVVKSTASFRCAAAPVAKAVFTDQGMLPAGAPGF